MSGMLSNGQMITTLLGTDLTITINSNGYLYIDNAMVTVTDIIGDNGVVHVIDAVLLPPTTNTIYDIISNSVDHLTLRNSIDMWFKWNIIWTWTIYSIYPTDNAFNNLPVRNTNSFIK